MASAVDLVAISVVLLLRRFAEFCPEGEGLLRRCCVQKVWWSQKVLCSEGLLVPEGFVFRRFGGPRRGSGRQLTIPVRRDKT